MSLLLISFFGLLALTFRSALYPVSEADSFEWDLELQEKLEGEANNGIQPTTPATDEEPGATTEEAGVDQDVFQSALQIEKPERYWFD